MQPDTQTAQIRVATMHLAALLLGLIGTALSLLQGRYWLAQPTETWLLILIGCVPVLAAIAFAIGPRHAIEDRSEFLALSSVMVWGNLAMPVVLTALTLVLVGTSGSFEHFAGFAMLLAANVGRNFRDLIHHWRFSR